MKLPQALCDAIKNGPLDEAIHRDWVLSWFANRSRPTAIEMRGILYPDKPSTEQQKRWLLCLKILLEFGTIRAVDLSSNQLTSMMSAVLDLFANRSSIRNLDLSNCGLTTSNLDLGRVREMLPNLQQISLAGNNLSIGLQTVDDDMTDTEEVMRSGRADISSILRNLLHLGGLRLLEVLDLSKTGLQCMGKKLSILSWVLARYTPIRAVNLSRNGFSQKKSTFIIAGFDELQAASKKHVLRLTLDLDAEKSRDLERRLDAWNRARMHENQDRAVVRLGLFSKEERVRAKTDLSNVNCIFDGPFKGPDVRGIIDHQQKSISARIKQKAGQILNPKKYRINVSDSCQNDENHDQVNSQQINTQLVKTTIHPNHAQINQLAYELTHQISGYVGGNKCQIKLTNTREK